MRSLLILTGILNRLMSNFPAIPDHEKKAALKNNL